MSLLSRLEAALERVAEGGAERVFGGRLDLVAVGQELYNQAVEASRKRDGGPLAPNAYAVNLALADYGHFCSEVEALQARYAVSLWGRLRESGYALRAPPSVLITPLDELPAGAFRIETAFCAAAPAFSLSNLTGRATVHRLETPATIGRDAECHLRLDSAGVSRQHAQVTWEHNGFVVVDLGSKNGTSVNGVPTPRAALEPGDVMTLGDVALRFEPEIGGLPTGDTR
ncbi:MAG: DUF2662 domain-containing protein [Armatimonadetes bacterium]|nr:DUF2662 domain-containing protein [Armatimonadota bacterium]